MRILYGVVGEGLGHAMRSRVVLEHLLERGHEVEVVASGRAAPFLEKHLADRSPVHPIHGLHIAYEDNQVDRSATFWSNLLSGARALPRQISAYFELLGDFHPELVISDFESFSYLFGQRHRLPILSLDNMQVLSRCRIDDAVIAGHRADFEIARALVRAKLPFCSHYFITTFFELPLVRPDTSFVPPILRPEILRAKPADGEHLLVYQTAEGNEALVEALQRTGFECRVYGMFRGITEERVDGNLRHRPFSEEGFITDLASARGVVAGGGFTLLGEAIFLRKPILSVPIRGQFEQVLNARYVEKLGYGTAADALSEAELQRFLARLPSAAERLAGYRQDGNELLKARLDAELERHSAN
jgi:uncharacterized protein (TIGR00661 family)